MSTVFVQFSDAKQDQIISVFGCAQDTEAYPNQASIDDSDERYVSFISSLPVTPLITTEAPV